MIDDIFMLMDRVIRHWQAWLTPKRAPEPMLHKKTDSFY